GDPGRAASGDRAPASARAAQGREAVQARSCCDGMAPGRRARGDPRARAAPRRGRVRTSARALLGRGGGRAETVREWMARLRQDPEAGAWRSSLEELAVAYYVSLFDPQCPEE